MDAASKVIDSARIVVASQVQSADATDHPLPDRSAGVWFTDPPYYDAIPYSDLSDFFLVWLKRTLPSHPLLRDPFDPHNPLSPKDREAVQDNTKKCDGRIKDRKFFEDVMGDAFAEGRRVLTEEGIGSVVFAHKTTEGWEALLSGMIRGGWTITGSWPIATERVSRLRARDSAALATSVHLICRPRPEDAPIGDWADVLRELPIRVADWIERLQTEGIRGADLVFACIGPALEIFSRYRAVETAEGDIIGLPDYLEKVWEVVGRAALQQVLGTAEARARNGLSGALEEDARLTALFLWTLQSTAPVTENRLWCMDRYFWVSRLNKDRLLSRLGMTFLRKDSMPSLPRNLSCPTYRLLRLRSSPVAVARRLCIGCVIGLIMMRGLPSAVA